MEGMMSAHGLRITGIACAAVVLGLIMVAAAARAQTGAPPTDPTQGMSEQEMRLRIELLRRSMGFGGIFGPALQGWLNAPSAPSADPSDDSSAPDDCAHYNEYAARQACGVGDLWGADRIEEGRASQEERDWYDR
jgi:hypothetical protein